MQQLYLPATFVALVVLSPVAGRSVSWQQGGDLGAGSSLRAAGHKGDSSITRAVEQVADGVIEPNADYWDYANNGVNWNVGQCAASNAGQSPMNFSEAVFNPTSDGEFLFYKYPLSSKPLTMLNNGRVLYSTLQDKLGGIALGTMFPQALTSSYGLWQIVIHTPSEHLFNGAQVPLELQLIHRKSGYTAPSDGSAGDPDAYAVVSFGFVVGGQMDESHFLNSLKQGGLPKTKNGESVVNSEYPSALDFSELFAPSSNGGNTSFVQYDGSLTVPPCTAGFRWFIRNETLPAELGTLAAFQNAAKSVSHANAADNGNARALQAAGGRTVIMREARDCTQLPNMDTSNSQAFAAGASSVAAAASASTDVSGTAVQQATTGYAASLQAAQATRSELVAAELRKADICAQEKKAKASFGTSGAGATRLDTGADLNSLQQQCSEARTTVEALQAQLVTNKAQLDTIVHAAQSQEAAEQVKKQEAVDSGNATTTVAPQRRAETNKAPGLPAQFSDPFTQDDADTAATLDETVASGNNYAIGDPTRRTSIGLDLLSKKRRSKL